MLHVFLRVDWAILNKSFGCQGWWNYIIGWRGVYIIRRTSKLVTGSGAEEIDMITGSSRFWAGT